MQGSKTQQPHDILVTMGYKCKAFNWILLILLTLTNNCIDPIEINITEEKKLLIVEGFISTGQGPHRIKLSKSVKFGNIFTGVIKGEEGAKVWVRDNDGKITFLTDEGRGIYATPVDWRAKLNESYTLNIRTSSGTHYTSLAETIIPVAPIDSLILQFKKIPTANPAIFITGVEVFARFQDPPETRDFYTWRNNGTFVIDTRPELHTLRNINNPGEPIPDPLPCCATCWVSEFNTDFSVKILDDKNSNGTINTVPVAFIIDDGLRFFSKYMVVIQQLSISKEAHAFFSLLDKQLSIDGDIFDPPPATIRGNMINLDNPEENVIGYFHASDVSSDTLFIKRELFSEEFRIKKVINDDCRVLPLSTAFLPDFWK